MMQIEIKEICNSNHLNCFSISIPVDKCTVLFDLAEVVSANILSTLIGVDLYDAGSIVIDGMRYDDYISTNGMISTFAMVFDEGIMLSNLTLRENLLLPWRLRFAGRDEQEFDADLSYWESRLNLDCDFSLRPAYVSPAKKKLCGFIRGLMLKPKVLLIDDPYYLFNKSEREQIYSLLRGLIGEQAMLIASADDDFAHDLADTVLKIGT